MADSGIKVLTEDLPAPDFETTAFTSPPPLSEATVAIVTTASLHHPDQDDFAPTDIGYRILDGHRRDYVTGHWSPNFDGAGFAYDMNTVFPLAGVRMDSGPAGAAWLREQGVDIALFTPV